MIRIVTIRGQAVTQHDGRRDVRTPQHPAEAFSMAAKRRLFCLPADAASRIRCTSWGERQRQEAEIRMAAAMQTANSRNRVQMPPEHNRNEHHDSEIVMTGR